MALVAGAGGLAPVAASAEFSLREVVHVEDDLRPPGLEDNLVDLFGTEGK